MNRATLAAFVALAVGCSSPTGPSRTAHVPLPATLPPPGVLTRGVMTATVDGVPGEAAGPVASLSGVAVGPTVVATIVGRIASSESMVSVTVPVAVGTYALGGTEYMDFALYQIVGGTPSAFWVAARFMSGSSAAVTVTAASTTRVAGTFSFTAVSPQMGASPFTRTVTHGVFDLSQ